MHKPATTTQVKRSRLFALASALFLWCALGTGIAAKPSGVGVHPEPPQHPDSIARLLAGLPPSHPNHTNLADDKLWKNHSQAIQASWSRARDGQLAAMKTWRDAELPRQCPVGDTLFYPFSGPDFLNAYALFPDCTTFVMFGLEPVGNVPNPPAMTHQEFANLLTNAREAMIDLFARNYFVTTTMKKKMTSDQAHGVLPVLMITMALSGVEVVRIGPPPFPPATGGRRELDGVVIEFRAPGSPRLRRVIFYSLDASDRGLAEYPEFVKYLHGLAPTTTLIKAASYLLHDSQFRKMRDVLLDTSAFLVQDDTGLPYALLRKSGWNMRTYGHYSMPIPPFENKFQLELAAAYDVEKARPLPFRFGYQINLGEKRSTLMVGRRSPVTRQSGSDVR